MPTLDEIRRIQEKRGIEFYFAQFVDMYARPSAKLVPAAHLDDLVTDGAGFAGFAAGEIGQLPSDPDLAAIPEKSGVRAPMLPPKRGIRSAPQCRASSSRTPLRGALCHVDPDPLRRRLF